VDTPRWALTTGGRGPSGLLKPEGMGASGGTARYGSWNSALTLTFCDGIVSVHTVAQFEP
jgi:hypothetical protein